jgi:hypothetical protein
MSFSFETQDVKTRQIKAKTQSELEDLFIENG